MNCQPRAPVLILVRIGHKAVRGEAAWSQVLTDLLGSDSSAQGCLLTYLCHTKAPQSRWQQGQQPGPGAGGSGDKASWWPWARGCPLALHWPLSEGPWKGKDRAR